MKKHIPINFSPFASNVLDYVGREDLVTENGEPVVLRREMSGHFYVKIGEREAVRTRENTQASYVLNQFNVGIRRGRR